MGKIIQVSIIVLMAIAISNFLAFALWRTSAIDDLHRLMVECFDSFSDSLSGITHSFLRGSVKDVTFTKYESIEASHRAVFGSLLKNLKEAKFEHYLRGTEKQHRHETLLVESMQRLAQNIGGLRSAAHTQFLLLKEIRERGQVGPTPMSAVDRHRQDSVDAGRLFTPPSRGRDYMPAERPAGMMENPEADSSSTDGVDWEPESNPLIVLDEFMYHLGPPMVFNRFFSFSLVTVEGLIGVRTLPQKSLAYTLKEILDCLPFEPAHPYRIDINPMFEDSLEKAVSLFDEKQREALNTLYRSEAITRTRSIEEAINVEEIAASCGYFSDNLTSFAEEIKYFLGILEELKNLQETAQKSWEWLKFWKRKAVVISSEEGTFSCF